MTIKTTRTHFFLIVILPNYFNHIANERKKFNPLELFSLLYFLDYFQNLDETFKKGKKRKENEISSHTFSLSTAQSSIIIVFYPSIYVYVSLCNVISFASSKSKLQDASQRGCAINSFFSSLSFSRKITPLL